MGIGLLHSAVALTQVTERSPVGLPQLGELTEGALGFDLIGCPRAYGLGFNPNPVGLFLAVVSILAYSLFLLNRSDWRARAFTLGVFVVTFWALVTTMSRSALLGWLSGLWAVSLLAWVGGSEARKTTITCVLLAVLSVVLVGAVLHIVTPKTTAAETQCSARVTRPAIQSLSLRFASDILLKGLQGRVADWKSSGPIINENLLGGVGAGNHPLALKARWSPNTFGSEFVPIHNVPLTALAELGVFGGALAVLIMAAPLVWLVSRRRIQRFEFYPLLWLGPVSVLLFVSLWEFTTWSTQDGRVLMWAVMGLWAGGIVAQSPSGRGNGASS